MIKTLRPRLHGWNNRATAKYQPFVLAHDNTCICTDPRISWNTDDGMYMCSKCFHPEGTRTVVVKQRFSLLRWLGFTQ